MEQMIKKDKKCKKQKHKSKTSRHKEDKKVTYKLCICFLS